MFPWVSVFGVTSDNWLSLENAKRILIEIEIADYILEFVLRSQEE